MKKQLIYLLTAVAALCVGCSDELTDGQSGYGTLHIAGAADGTIDTRATTTPAGADFSVILTRDDYKGEWATVAEFEAADTLLKEGHYNALIAHGDPNAEGVDKPYYVGRQAFELLPRRLNTVSVTAQIANSQLFVQTTPAFRAYFHEALFTVTTASKNVFTFRPGATSTDVAVYVKAATSLTITGTARRQSQTGVGEGVAVKFGEQTLAATTPRTRHTFSFDAKDAGSATLTISLGDGVAETRELNVELNDAAIPDPVKSEN
ncbi:MAG: DUF4493 domain-containing protein [Alistipes sp.]